MRYAIDAAIKSYGGDGEMAFDPTKVPAARPVESNDPKTIGVGLLAVLRNWRTPMPGGRWKREQMYPAIRAARRASERE
jgi:hypothetical protein